MLIKEWFYKKTRRHFFGVVSLLILVHLCLLGLLSYRDYQDRIVTVKSSMFTISLAIQQNNRSLLEHELTNMFRDIHAKEITIREQNSIILAYPSSAKFPQKTSLLDTFTIDIEFPIPGQEQYILYGTIWSVKNWFYLLLVLPTLLLLIAFYRLASVSLYRQINKDLLIPLASGLHSNHPLELTELEELRNNVQDYFMIKGEIKAVEVKRDVYRKLAHDIRSPVLSMQNLYNSSAKPADRKTLKIIIDRIISLSEGFLSQTTMQTPKNTPILTFVKEITDELKLRYSDRNDIKWISEFENKESTVMLEGPTINLKRAIANIANNAIEAMHENGGTISFCLTHSKNKALLAISDTGCGIAEDLLSKLGETEITKNKEGGYGVGILSAKQAINAVGGSLRYKSQLKKGTTACISLNTTQTCYENVNIVLTEGANLVIFSEKPSIHQEWRNFLNQVDNSESINICSASTLAEIPSDIATKKDGLLIIDWDTKANVIDFIDENHLHDIVVIFSKNPNNKELLDYCKPHGISHQPIGSMTNHICISIAKRNDKIYGVLLDDDYLIRTIWKAAASQKGLNLVTCESYTELQETLAGLDKDVRIYLDYHFGHENMTGYDVAQILSQEGYKCIHIETAVPAALIENQPKYVRSILNKKPPF